MANNELAMLAIWSNHILSIVDNADSRIPWMEDKLATYATGFEHQTREYYTTNGLARFQMRCRFLALTSRDPRVVNRVDVMQRAIVFRHEPPRGGYVAEGRAIMRAEDGKDEPGIMTRLVAMRDGWGAGLLEDVRKIAAILPDDRAPKTQFRMADFAAFAHACFAAWGLGESAWRGLLSRLTDDQRDVSAEGNVLIEILRITHERQAIIAEPSAELFSRCDEIYREAYPHDQKRAIPARTDGLTRAIKTNQQVIAWALNVEVIISTVGKNHTTTITFKPLGVAPLEATAEQRPAKY